MKLCDMHCDTLTELFGHGYSLSDSPLHISLEKAASYANYIQLAAVWTDCALSNDEGYRRFFDVIKYFENDPSVLSGKVRLVRTKDAFLAAEAGGAFPFILGVEGARILNSDISRLDMLEAAGVRLMTLLWSGEDCIGGAYDTNSPLTDFGRTVVHELARRRIATDISHSCPKTASEALDIAIPNGGPVCASHSNSYTVTPHPRNLSDELFIRIRDAGGVVGISLCPHHLKTDGNACIFDAVRHILHYLSLRGEDTVCLGCDYDGIETTPAGLENVGLLPCLKDALSAEGVDDGTIQNIFYKNARRFLEAILA